MIIAGFDTETTGLDAAAGHRIIELAMVLVNADDWSVVTTYEQRFNPGRPIDAKAQDVHGISISDVSMCPEFWQKAPEIEQMLGSADLFVAHNMAFDADFIAHEMMRAGIEIPGTRTLCTMEEARWATYDGKSPKLMELAFALGVDYDPSKAHAALYDVHVMMQCLKLGERQGFFDIEPMQITDEEPAE